MSLVFEREKKDFMFQFICKLGTNEMSIIRFVETHDSIKLFIMSGLIENCSYFVYY